MKKIGAPKLNALIYPWNEASLKFFFKSLGYGVQTVDEAEKWLTTGRHHLPRSKKPQHPKKVVQRL